MTVDLHYYARNEGTSDIQDMRGEFQLNRNVKKEMRFSSTIQHSSDFPPTLLDARRAMAEPGDLSYFGLSPKKSRAKESSKYFGVRFRPDLQKWVAEIRVAEWKSVDKKVWLGTFDSEEGAARAVDAARKLLKCKKKRGFNIPSAELDAYSEKIPSNLKLTNLLDDSMFKEVTLFVKKRAQEYASSFTSGQVFTSSDYQVQPDLSYFDVNLLQRIGDPLQEEVSCLASQSSALHGLELYNDQTCAVIAASYPCSCFSSLNNFSPPSCVSDGRCSSLDASNEAQENLLQAYEDACYRRGAGGSDWQNFGSYSSPNSNVESQHETDTTYDHVLLEEQGLGCSGNMRNAGHSSDFWDVIDECMFDNQVHWGRHHSAMDLTTGDEMQPCVDIPMPNVILSPQYQFTTSNVNTSTDSQFNNSQTTVSHALLNSTEFSQAVC